eukprot:7859902-Alexandrium_andersonii.AAC.1
MGNAPCATARINRQREAARLVHTLVSYCAHDLAAGLPKPPPSPRRTPRGPLGGRREWRPPRR